MRLRRYIAGSLWIGGLLLVVLLVAAALWAILWQAGDEAGAQGAKGVFLVALVSWGLNFIALVVLSALAQVNAAGDAADERRGLRDEG